MAKAFEEGRGVADVAGAKSGTPGADGKGGAAVSTSRPTLDREKTKVLLSTRYVSVYELAYEDGTRYFDASRKGEDDLLALKDEDALAQVLPDAVSVILVVKAPDGVPRLVLFREWRYPVAQYVLSVPAGLIDPADRATEDPVATATRREVGEETGVILGPDDPVSVVSPLVFNTPGFTDESTALVSAVAHVESLSQLSQAGAEGTERFGGFELATREDARRWLRDGVDAHGRYYPLNTWAAMAYFVSHEW